MESVSVIVPVYQAEKYITQCIESIRAQTYANFELILIDDGSHDASGRICDQYAEKDGRIRVIHKENGGLVAAWTDGIRVADKPLVMFVDADDWIDERTLETFVNEYIRTRADIVCGSYCLEYSCDTVQVHNNIPSGVYDKKRIETAILPTILYTGKFLERGMIMSRSAKLIKRELLLENSHWAAGGITIGEDLCVILPCVLRSEKISVINEACMYHYRSHDESMTHDFGDDAIEKIVTLYKRELEIIDAFDCENLLKEQIVQDFCALCVNVFLGEYVNRGTFINMAKFRKDRFYPAARDNMRPASYRGAVRLIAKKTICQNAAADCYYSVILSARRSFGRLKGALVMKKISKN